MFLVAVRVIRRQRSVGTLPTQSAHPAIQIRASGRGMPWLPRALIRPAFTTFSGNCWYQPQPLYCLLRVMPRGSERPRVIPASRYPSRLGHWQAVVVNLQQGMMLQLIILI